MSTKCAIYLTAEIRPTCEQSFRRRSIDERAWIESNFLRTTQSLSAEKIYGYTCWLTAASRRSRQNGGAAWLSWLAVTLPFNSTVQQQQQYLEIPQWRHSIVRRLLCFSTGAFVSYSRFINTIQFPHISGAAQRLDLVSQGQPWEFFLGFSTSGHDTLHYKEDLRLKVDGPGELPQGFNWPGKQIK